MSGADVIRACLTADAARDARPVWTIPAAGYEAWLTAQPEPVRAWLTGSGFEAKPARTALLPDTKGRPAGALLIVNDPAEPWDFATLRSSLPAGDWRLEAEAVDRRQAALGFALGAYRFERYRKRDDKMLRLAVGNANATAWASVVASAVWLARDLINTPAADLGPAELADAVRDVGARFGATCRVIAGEEVARENFPAVHTVGQASSRPPHVIDLGWGDEDAPRLTLVGKGVCFDTGGLDLKPAAGMRLMKKDMGGAAVTLALAQAVMALDLPVRLRLLIGAVDNAVSGASFRPGDVLRTRKGLTVEIGNTDAEGRLVLADLLAAADGEQPAMMLDCATLTGAARVALGPDLPALFTPDDGLAEQLLAAGRAAFDPLWRLPLHAPYRELIESPIADLDNAGKGGFAGAITAALFLERFVTETRAWAHFDLFAWNPESRPGRPGGGEASGLRALLAAIERRFAA